MTETEALAAIAALADTSVNGLYVASAKINAILARAESGAVPPQDIDRGELLGILWTVKRGGDPHWALREILALVRPVEGVWISREEAAVAVTSIRARLSGHDVLPDEIGPTAALAEKLEAAS
jgi:hypothetical protein